MANITRIKNNQVTDNTIEYQKIKDGTLVGSKFNPNLTLNSNVMILGNLTVANSYTQLNSINTYINDPVVVFNNNYTGSPAYDIGMLVNRNLSSLLPYGAVNAAWVWKEVEQKFVGIMTTETGTTAGSINNSGYANVQLGNLTANSITISTGFITSPLGIQNTPIGNVTPSIGYFTTLYATGFSTANAVIAGGYISALTNAAITTGTVSNFFSANVFINGGYVNNLANITAGTGYVTSLNSTTGNVTTLYAQNLSTPNLSVTTENVTTLSATNFSTGNAAITGAQTYIGTGTVPIANVYAGTGYFTNVSTPNLSVTTENVTTLSATNFSSGNIRVSGGYISNLSNATIVTTNTTNGNVTTLSATNFSTGNAQITGGSLTGITNATATTSQATNFSTGNAQITGGSLTGITNATATTSQATNFSTGNAQITGGSLTGLTNLESATGYFTNVSTPNLSVTTENVTTLSATNFSSGNIRVSGGYISALTNATVTTSTVTNETVTNFGTGNAQITGGSLTGITNATATTSQATNFSTGNAQITGGSLTGITNLSATTAVATNFSTGNARITSGYADNFPIGANTKATGAFTTLTSNGITTFTNGTDATSTTTGALQVTGGVGITGNLWVGGNIYAANIIATTQNIITIEDPLLYLRATGNLTTYNYDIGFYSDYSAPYYVHSGLARSVASNAWIFFSNVQSEPQATTVNWNDLGLIYDTVKAGALLLANTTPSSSSASGALQVSGGAGISGQLYAAGLHATTGNITTLAVTSGFSSGNASITGAQTYIGTGAGPIANIYASTGYFTNLSVANISGVINESVTTLVATNLSTGNAVISGGYISALTNATITTTTITNETVTNFYTANARIQGGYIQNLANITATTGYIVNENITNGNVTTLYAQHFNTGNAAITGAQTYIGTGAVPIANVYAGTGYFTNVSTPNLSVTTENVTTLYAQNFSTGNAQITGGSLTGITNATAATSQATNFSTGNARITGGYADNFPIGANVQAPGKFTTLSASSVSTFAGNLVLTAGTDGISNTDGALVITGDGGLAVGGNINAGQFNHSVHNLQGNLLLGLGNRTASADTILTINLNTDTPIVSNATVHISAATNKPAQIGLDSFGAALANSNFTGRKARGTSTTPTAIQANDLITTFLGRGYGTTGYKSAPTEASGLIVSATENYTDSAQGTRLVLTAIPDGTTTAIAPLVLGGNGIVTVTQNVSSTSPSTGALVVAGGTGITGNLHVGFRTHLAGILQVDSIATISGNLVANSGTNSTSTTSGALVVAGGAGIQSNIFVGGAGTFNSSMAVGFDTLIMGHTDQTLLWARPGTTYDQLVIGGNATVSTLVTGAKLIINSTDAMILPMGTNIDRPGTSGGTDVMGMFRYNTSLNSIEYFNGATWESPGLSYTVITDQQYTGDGGTINYSLSTSQTTASCIVSINGILQAPVLAYVVSGTVLTFSEAPAVGDIIDVRALATTQTVTTLSSTTGYNSITVEDTTAITFSTGVLAQLARFRIPLDGGLVSLDANISVASANTLTTIDSFSNSNYRTAKYIVQVTNSTSYQSSEALVIQNGTTATMVEYAIVRTNGNLGVLSTSVLSGNTRVQFIAASATNNVRIFREYVPI